MERVAEFDRNDWLIWGRMRRRTHVNYHVESWSPAWSTVAHHDQGGSHAIDHDEGTENIEHRHTTSSPHQQPTGDVALRGRIWVQRRRPALRLGSQDGENLAPALGSQWARRIGAAPSGEAPPTHLRRGGAVDRAGAPRAAVWGDADPVLAGSGASHPRRGRDNPPDLPGSRLSANPAHRPATPSTVAA